MLMFAIIFIMTSKIVIDSRRLTQHDLAPSLERPVVPIGTVVPEVHGRTIDRITDRVATVGAHVLNSISGKPNGRL